MIAKFLKVRRKITEWKMAGLIEKGTMKIALPFQFNE
jgi:hypothetical protein